jgi:hypothetical protein
METLMKYLFITAACLLASITVKAGFSEIDIMARESVAGFMSENDKNFDENSFQYDGEPKTIGQIMTIQSSINAQEKMSGKWMLHRCETRIDIRSKVDYQDLGSDCYADHD